MKPAILACLILAATSAFAQTSSQPRATAPLPEQPPTVVQKAIVAASAKDFARGVPAGQTGCPVHFTDVSLKTRGRTMLVRQGESPDGALAFTYQNQSGKTIASIAVRVNLKIKGNVYDLDAADFTLAMVLTGKGLPETLPLNVRGYAYGVSGLTLERVAYSDGTSWTASASHACKFDKLGSMERTINLQ